MLALAGWAVASSAAAYVAVVRLGAVQGVLAFALRRVLARLQLATAGYESTAEWRASGSRALPAVVRRTSTGAAPAWAAPPALLGSAVWWQSRGPGVISPSAVHGTGAHMSSAARSMAFRANLQFGGGLAETPAR